MAKKRATRKKATRKKATRKKANVFSKTIVSFSKIIQASDVFTKEE